MLDKTMIEPNTNVIECLQAVCTIFDYKLVHGVINTKQDNHRYIFTDKKMKILIELSKA